MYGEGVSKMGEIIDLGVKAGVVEKSGAWFSYDSQRIGQGRENAKTFLKNNPDIAGKIEAPIRANSGLIAEKILAGRRKKTRTTTRRASLPSPFGEGARRLLTEGASNQKRNPPLSPNNDVRMPPLRRRQVSPASPDRSLRCGFASITSGG